MAFRTKEHSAYIHSRGLHTITVEQAVDNPCKSTQVARRAMLGANCTFFDQHGTLLFVDACGKVGR